MAAKKKGRRVAAAKRGAKRVATRVKAGAKKLATRVKAGAKKAVKKVRPARARKAQPIPDGFGTVTASLVIRGASAAIAFYKKAFGARERNRMPGPDGRLMHAEIQIGDSVVMLSDEYPEMGSKAPQTLGGTSASLLIYTRDVDALFARATAAGATVSMPLADQFWGDRYGKVVDPFGHEWQLATHKEDLDDAQMAERAAAAFSGPPPGAQ